MAFYIGSMKRVFECFFIIIPLLVASPAYAMEMINVVVYGDSLTSGYKLPPEDSYAAQLGKKFRDLGYVNVKTVNLSVPGETSSGGLERLSSLILKDPDVVVLELGANDILRGISPKNIYSNLGHIIRRLKDKNVYVVLIGMKAPPNLGQEYAAQVDNLYFGLAENFQLAYYPFALEGIFGKPEFNLADGYHPNGKGIELMVENTYRLVDLGVRWKYDIMRYEEEYQRDWKEKISQAQ